jgi:hypothetical protein
MNITFGIITNSQVNQDVLNSIFEQNILNYEIIVVGGLNNYSHGHINHFYFDESFKKNWITRKKNLIIDEANFENIVFLHDYFRFSTNWYENQKKISDFDVCMNRILNVDGTRFRDWCAWDDPDLCYHSGHSIILPSYEYTKTEFMYISGGYWIAKKDFMKKNKLNEELCWGEGEDVEWSKRIRNNFNYVMNVDSVVHCTKYKGLSAKII